MTPWVALNVRSVLTHVAVGMGAASFWRGAWYVLDDNLLPGNPAGSAATSLALGTVGMGLSQGMVHRMDVLQQALAGGQGGSPFRRLWTLRLTRFGALYTIAMSCVLVWRGTWLGWDVVYEYSHPEQHICQQTNLKRINSTDPGHATTSGMLSHGLAVVALVGTGLFASVLAPPAATSVIRDLTVKSGSKAYTGPAQRVWQQFVGSNAGTTAAASSTSVMARSYQTKPTMSRHNNTTRVATSVHKF